MLPHQSTKQYFKALIRNGPNGDVIIHMPVTPTAPHIAPVAPLMATKRTVGTQTDIPASLVLSLQSANGLFFAELIVFGVACTELSMIIVGGWHPPSVGWGYPL